MGLGKLFISTHLAYLFSTKYNKKTLLIDTDTQGHAAMYYSGNVSSTNTIGDLMFGRASFDDVVIRGDIFDLVPSNEFLSQTENLLVSTIAREKLLDRTLSDHGVYNNYEIIIFDTSPSISLINQNVAVASDYYLIPTGLDPLGYAGCISTIEFVNTLKRLIDIKTKLLGIVPILLLGVSLI